MRQFFRKYRDPIFTSLFLGGVLSGLLVLLYLAVTNHPKTQFNGNNNGNYPFEYSYNSQTKSPSWVMETIDNRHSFQKEVNKVDIVQDSSIPSLLQINDFTFNGTQYKPVPLAMGSTRNGEYPVTVCAPMNREFSEGYWKGL